MRLYVAVSYWSIQGGVRERQIGAIRGVFRFFAPRRAGGSGRLAPRHLRRIRLKTRTNHCFVELAQAAIGLIQTDRIVFRAWLNRPWTVHARRPGPRPSRARHWICAGQAPPDWPYARRSPVRSGPENRDAVASGIPTVS